MSVIFNYYVEYWDCGNQERNKEVIDCINSNIESDFFDNVFVFSSTNEVRIKSDIIKTTRITYQSIFDIDENGINILANSDIQFDESIKNISIIKDDEFYALTRYEADGKLHKYDDPYRGSDSQDVWIWKDRCKITNANYSLGIPGCDNKIAYDAHISGYSVKNPSMTIKTHHKHTTNSREGTSGSVKYRLDPPYKLVLPTL
jgi:hypothetical protein